MPIYTVIGASSHLARLAVQQLLARAAPPSADLAVRDVQVREADHVHPETLGAAHDLLTVRSKTATSGLIGAGTPCSRWTPCCSGHDL